MFSSSTTSSFSLPEVTSRTLALYPIKLNSTLKGGFELVSNRYIPSKSAETPIEVPTTTTLAPTNGSPFESVILPLTMVCAFKAKQNNKAGNKKMFLSCFLNMVHYFCSSIQFKFTF